MRTRLIGNNGMPMRLGGWLYLAAKLILAGIFIYAGVVKLADPEAFARIIAEYNLVPESLLPLTAYGLPALEVLAGAGLLLEVRGSLFVLTGLTVMFAAVLWFGILQELHVDCGCFSSEELAGHDSLRQALYRDLVMLAGAAYMYVWRWAGRVRHPAAGLITNWNSKGGSCNA